MDPSEQIDGLIAKLGDWRGAMIADLRRIIHEADPDVIEEWKWMGAPVFSDHGMLCLTNAFKDKVKVTFSEGAMLPDPHKLFNNGLEGKQWRTIDFYKGDKVNENALKTLIRAAVHHNLEKVKSGVKKKSAK